MANAQIFNRARILARKTAAYDERQFFYGLLFEDMIERTALLTRVFENVLVIAPPSIEFKTALLNTGKFNHITWVWHTPPVPELEPCVQRIEEQLPFNGAQFDCILSIAELAWTNAVPQLLHQMRALLKPDGLFMALFAGGNTLTELRQCLIQAETELTGGIASRIHPMIEVRAMGSLLQNSGFALPVVDVDTHTITYRDISRLFEDIKAHGAGNGLAGHHAPLPRAVLVRALEIYGREFSDSNQKAKATLEIISASGWAPHASQQQPLKPGSAKVRLGDVL